MTPSPDLASQISQGRAVGYSDDEMLSFLSKRSELGDRISKARSAGYGSGEILDYLAPSQPASQPKPFDNMDMDYPPVGMASAHIPPVNPINRGQDDVAQGISEVGSAKSGSDVAQGVSDMARGAGKMGLPAMAPGLATVPGIAGAVAGAAAGYGTEQGLNSAGVPPGYSALAGTIAGAGVGVGAAAGTQAAFKINPQIAAERAWRPAPTDSDFPAVAPSAGSDVKTYGSPGVRTNAATIPASKAAVDVLQQGLETYLNRAEQAGVQIPGDILVQAAQQAIPDLMWTQDPASAQSLVDSAQRAFGGKYFDVGRWRGWLKAENASLSRFYDQAGARQASGVSAGTPPGIESAQAAAMREALYQYLSPEDQGAGPREIQERTGHVINLRNLADRASNRVTGEHALSPAEGFGKSATGAARMVGAPFQHGDVPGAYRQMTNPMQGPTDALIGQFYDAVPHATPIPQPASPQHPFASFQAQRSLPAPLTNSSTGGGFPPTPDPSYVRAQQGMYPTGPNPARALPPGRQPIVTPAPDYSNPASDPSRVTGYPAMRADPTTRALPPARTFIVPPADAFGPHPATSSSPLVSPSGPTYGVTPENLATKLGRSVRQFLGDPTVK